MANTPDNHSQTISIRQQNLFLQDTVFPIYCIDIPCRTKLPTFLCNISLQLVLLVIKKGEGYFWPFYFSFLCLTATTAAEAAEAAEATEVPIEAEAEAEVVEAESPMEAAEAEAVAWERHCFRCY